MAFPVPPSSSSALSYPRPSFIRPHIQVPRARVSLPFHLSLSLRPRRKLLPLSLAFSSAGDNSNDGDKGNDNIGGGGGGGLGDDGVDWSDGNRGEALLVLRKMGRKLESLPDDLAAAVEVGRVTGDTVKRFAEMEGSPLLSPLMQSHGLRERILADNLFLAKVATECAVGIASKTAEEYERRKDNFLKEIDTVVPYVGVQLLDSWTSAAAAAGGLATTASTGQTATAGGALLVLREMGRKLESLPDDLAAAVEVGSVTGDMVKRFAEMEGSPLLSWLMQSQGLRDRLLADNLFLAKLATECGVGIASKTAEEYERRKENFFKEMDTVVPYVAMSMVANFMLVYIPAPTLSLQPPLGTTARIIASLSSNYPDITSQIAFGVRSYLLVERIVKLVRISPKLFAVTTGASLVDTTVTSALIIDTVVKEPDDRLEAIPVVSNLDKVEDKEWTSFFGVGAEITAGFIPTHSMVDGRFPEIPCPAAIARASKFLSRCTFGRSRKHGTA